jgi:hypothetical protein
MDEASSTYGERRDVYRALVGKPEVNRPFGGPRFIWSMILKWIFKTWEGVVWTGLVWLRIGICGGLL